MNAHTFFKHPRDVSFLYLCRGDTPDFRDQIGNEAAREGITVEYIESSHAPAKEEVYQNSLFTNSYQKALEELIYSEAESGVILDGNLQLCENFIDVLDTFLPYLWRLDFIQLHQPDDLDSFLLKKTERGNIIIPKNFDASFSAIWYTKNGAKKMLKHIKKTKKISLRKNFSFLGASINPSLISMEVSHSAEYSNSENEKRVKGKCISERINLIRFSYTLAAKIAVRDMR